MILWAITASMKEHPNSTLYLELVQNSKVHWQWGLLQTHEEQKKELLRMQCKAQIWKILSVLYTYYVAWSKSWGVRVTREWLVLSQWAGSLSPYPLLRSPVGAQCLAHEGLLDETTLCNLHEDRASGVNTQLTCIEHLLCARHHPKWFSCIPPSKLESNPLWNG